MSRTFPDDAGPDDAGECLRSLVGPVDQRMLRFVDVYAWRDMAVCLPMAGQCGFAVQPDHVHPAYMFVIPFDRRNRVRIGDREFALPRGRLIGLSPGLRHQELPAAEAPRYICFLLDAAFLARQALPEAPPTFVGEHYPVPSGLLARLREFMAECRSGLPGRDNVLSALAVLVCQSVLRAAGGQSPHAAAGAAGMEAAVQLIESGYPRRLDLARLAREANMSPDHFGRVFKARFGATPMEHLRRVRLESARKMLLDEGKSVTQVALDCGFASLAHFSAAFAQAFAVSPSAYRRGLTNPA